MNRMTYNRAINVYINVQPALIILTASLAKVCLETQTPSTAIAFKGIMTTLKTQAVGNALLNA